MALLSTPDGTPTEEVMAAADAVQQALHIAGMYVGQLSAAGRQVVRAAAAAAGQAVLAAGGSAEEAAAASAASAAHAAAGLGGH
jgi:hypothetical protein